MFVARFLTVPGHVSAGTPSTPRFSSAPAGKHLNGIEVTINTVYPTLLMYYPSLVDVQFIATCFGSIEPSSGNIHMFY
jgi:hypothetical protein